MRKHVSCRTKSTPFSTTQKTMDKEMEIIDDEVEIQEDDTSPEEQNLSQLFCGALSSLWFSAPIKSFDSVKQRHDLSPEGALCL